MHLVLWGTLRPNPWNSVRRMITGAHQHKSIDTVCTQTTAWVVHVVAASWSVLHECKGVRTKVSTVFIAGALGSFAPTRTRSDAFWRRSSLCFVSLTGRVRIHKCSPGLLTRAAHLFPFHSLSASSGSLSVSLTTWTPKKQYWETLSIYTLKHSNLDMLSFDDGGVDAAPYRLNWVDMSSILNPSMH